MIYKYAQGGTLPMSNTMYPMARLTGSTYAAPLGYNQPNEVVGGYDAQVDPMTGEERPQTNFADGGDVNAPYVPSYSPPMLPPFMDDSGRGPTPGQPRLKPIDPYHPVPPFGSQMGGIGPYIDELNRRFAAGPSYGTRGPTLPYVGPGGPPVNPQPGTQPPGPDTGSRNPITGGTYTYPVATPEEPPIVPPEPTFPTMRPPVPPAGGLNLRDNPDKERRGELKLEELPEKPSYDDIQKFLNPPVPPAGGVSLRDNPDKPTKERGGVLIPEELSYDDMQKFLAGNYNNPPAQYNPFSGINLPAPDRRGSVSIENMPYGDIQNFLAGRTDLTGSSRTPYADALIDSSGYKYEDIPTGTGGYDGDPFAYNYGSPPAERGGIGSLNIGQPSSGDYQGFNNAYEADLYSRIASDNRVSNPELRKDPAGYIANQAKRAFTNFAEHPKAKLADLLGSALTGVPGIGTAISKGYDYLTRSETGMTPEEEALYSQIGETQTPSKEPGAAPEPVAKAPAPTPASLYQNASPTDIGPGSTSNTFRGTADVNAINFLTGAFNGVPYGSPTSMVDMSSMLNPYAAPSAEERAAQPLYNQSFYDQSQDLRDYAASHPIGTADPFSADRQQYFANHPELDQTTGRIKDDRTPQQIAAANDMYARYKALQDQYAASQAAPSGGIASLAPSTPTQLRPIEGSRPDPFRLGGDFIEDRTPRLADGTLLREAAPYRPERDGRGDFIEDITPRPAVDPYNDPLDLFSDYSRMPGYRGRDPYTEFDSGQESNYEEPIGRRPEIDYAAGGLAALPEYKAGGKFLRGPGDGMSDDIKANIDGHQEARLADGEFVIPADVVSHLGNGSSEAGSRKLYAMMDKIRMARTGRKAQGKQINPHKFLPA